MNLAIKEPNGEISRTSQTVALYEHAAKVSSLKLAYSAPENTSFCPLVPGTLGNASKFLYREPSTYSLALMSAVYAPLIFLLPLSGHQYLRQLYCVLFPITFLFIVLGLVWFRLFLYYGKNTNRAIKAPTTITIAPLSMKFQWQGWAFLPQLAAVETVVGWQDIMGLSFDNSEDTGPCITVKAWLQDGEHSFPVYLNGFASAPEVAALVKALDRNVDEEKKSDSFKEHFHPNAVAKQI